MLRVRRRTISGCLELDGSEIELLCVPLLNLSNIPLTYGLRKKKSACIGYCPEVSKQYRFEEIFIPNTQVFDRTQSPSVARGNGEFIIAAEHRHDLEIWRREICKIGRREGVYLGRTGTFVMSKWEVAVLPGYVLHEGEVEEEVEVSYKKDEFWIPWGRGHYQCVSTTFGKLDPWRMGLVAVQPSQETGTSTADQKQRRKGNLLRFLSAISRR